MATPTDQRPATRTRVRDFLYHLVVFVFVGGLLVILDVRAGSGDDAILGMDWAFWVLLFWGLALAAHAVYAAFGDSD
jgi:hypothetical protein